MNGTLSERWPHSGPINRRRGRLSPSEFDSPVFRSALGSTPSGFQETLADPFRCCDTSTTRSLFYGRPAVVIHSEIALRGMARRWPAAWSFGFWFVSHAHIIWAPTKFASLYFVGGHREASYLQCTEKLGVMSPTKKPRCLLITSAGAKNNRAFARSLRTTAILARAAHESDSAMPRKDFTAVRDKFARDNGLPFGRLLSREYVLSVLEDAGHAYRNRVFCPLVTLWAWLSQCLSQDKSLNEAVSRIVAHRATSGLPPCSANSASYSVARSRFPSEVMPRMAKEIGRNVHESRDTEWDWRGRPVLLADGTGFSMPDTFENQRAYPQVRNVEAGLGFPIMRAVALISLSTGAVTDLAFAAHEGKGTGESTLLRGMMDSMNAGDVLVADKYYPSFFTIALLKQRGVDLVSISHTGRNVDFSTGEVLGDNDHIAQWSKPPSVQIGWMPRPMSRFPTPCRSENFR